MKKAILFIVIGILAISSLIYFLRNRPPVSSGTANGKLRVVASFYPLYYFASQIGGDNAQVLNITPAGAEPHDYEPTAREIVQIEQSDLLLLNGGNLEPWGKEIKDELVGGHPVIVSVGEGLFDEPMEENGKIVPDPHVWLSPVLAKKVAESIAQGFIRVDPADASLYLANAKTLEDRLDVLDKKFAQGLDECAKQDIFTSHAAFGYLASRYHFNQVAITGISPDEEPSTQRLAKIADLAKAKGIKYIFFESLVNPKLSQALAREMGADVLILDPLEGLGGEDLRAGKDYFTQMEMNLANLKIALQCRT